ncbi:MAG: hypothetical protein M0Z28_25550 [Rhodospirillales bacterium]|nr:hypothetical protein [Rhodospirillales bacterium]
MVAPPAPPVPPAVVAVVAAAPGVPAAPIVTVTLDASVEAGTVQRQHPAAPPLAPPLAAVDAVSSAPPPPPPPPPHAMMVTDEYHASFVHVPLVVNNCDTGPRLTTKAVLAAFWLLSVVGGVATSGE